MCDNQHSLWLVLLFFLLLLCGCVLFQALEPTKRLKPLSPRCKLWLRSIVGKDARNGEVSAHEARHVPVDFPARLHAKKPKANLTCVAAFV